MKNRSDGKRAQLSNSIVFPRTPKDGKIDLEADMGMQIYSQLQIVEEMSLNSIYLDVV